MSLVHARAGVIMESDLAKSMTTGNGKHGNGCPRCVVRRKRTCRFVVTCSSLPAKLSFLARTPGAMLRRELARSGYSHSSGWHASHSVCWCMYCFDTA